MKIALFQRGVKGEHILEGLKTYGKGMKVDVYSVPDELPLIIDEPEEYIRGDFEADLVLDYLYHNDLSEHLVEVAKKKKVPMIVPGRLVPGAITPKTCCTFSIEEVPVGQRTPALVEYSKIFGVPDMKVTLASDGRVLEVVVRKGAPCGSTWRAAQDVVGLHINEALPRFGLSVQHHCHAPTGYDAVRSKKAPLHIASDTQGDAFEDALGNAKENSKET